MDAKRNIQSITLSLMTIVILVMAGCASNKMTSQEKAVQKALLAQKITESLRQRDYQIDVSQATPDGWGRVIQLTSLYSVKVSGDTIISNLPFFGRAYSVPYGGGSGLNFTGMIRRYDETVTRKGEHILYLDVESQEDVYRYIISLFENGKATISVSPRQRSHIYFSGYFHEE